LQRYPAEGAARDLLVLAHGAGAGHRHPFMVTMAKGLAERGIDVVTFDFPYIREKRKVPDKAPVLEAAFRDAVRQAVDEADGPRRLFVGGKSMGGRIATHLAAQGLDGLHGVVALGYPLHPPGKPDQLRDAHLPAIRVPLLIVQGERDAFGTPDELRPVVARMEAPVALHVVTSGDHSLAVPKAAGTPQREVYREVLERIGAWFSST
jgi:predicted alpha/beta-hydrolase family hydrolase